MRILPLLVVGLSALALSACDELRGTPQASADCCCKTCPTPPPVAKPAPAPAETAAAQAEADVEAAPAVRRTRAVVQRRTHRSGGAYRSAGYRSESHRSGGYRYRSGTEGVGYLDEDLAGGPRGGSYRRVEIDERESYSERYSASESSSAYASGGYSYSEGSYEASGGGHRRGGHKRHRDHDRGYVGTDRYGYLTWPGKTP